MTDITRLKITGMTCDHCVKRATEALQAVTGVDEVDVSLQPGGATVHGNTDAETLIAAVVEAGYQAELA